MSLLSIDVGTSGISVVHGAFSAGRIDITAAESALLHAEAPTGSTTTNYSEIVSAIRQVLDKRGFKTGKAVVTIAAGNALVREFTVPDGKPKQIETMVANEMVASYSALSSDVVEFKKIGEEVGENGVKGIKVRAMAVRFEAVDRLHSVLLEAKLKPEAMDCHANSIEKLLALRPSINGADMSDKNYLMLDFGYSGVMAYVVSGYQVYASRFVPIGLSDFEPLLEEFRYGEPGGGIRDIAGLLDFSDEGDPMLTQAAETIIVQCCNEIQKLSMYALSRLTQNSISNAFLFGGGSRIAGIEKFMSGELNTDVQAVSSVSAIRFKDPREADNLAFYLNAAGALIRLQ